MNDMATPSVSLEGKSLWLAQSLPVKPWQVLRAKLKVQLALTALPALVPLACMAFILPVTAALPLVFAEALAYIAFSACLGLTLGVARANLTWTSELMPIKQSLAVTIALFGGWLYAIVFAGLYLWQGWKLGAAAYLAIAAAVTLAVTALLLRWLKTKGRTALCDAVKENKMRECGGRRTAALLLYRRGQKITQFVLAESGGPCCYVTTLTSRL